MSTITQALGADAEALVQRPGAVTAKQAIREALWGTNKSQALATLQGAIGEYDNALRDLRKRYSPILMDLDREANGAGNPLAVPVKKVIELLDAAKPDVGDGKLEPMAAAAASATAIAVLNNKTKSVAERECSKILDPRTNPDCGVYTRILAIDPMDPLASHPMDPLAPHPVERLTTAAKGFSSARTDLATEFGLLLTGVLVVPSRPSEVTASNPSYTDAASLYISGDVGITMPVFVNTSRSYGTDTVLYVAASVSFVSVDKDVPLAKDGGFLRRFSIVGGFTLGQVMNSDGTITGVIAGKGLLLGVGLRVTDYVRLGVGTMVLRQNDTGKLIPDTHVRLAPYLSLSIDLDVAGIVTGMFAKGAGLHL